jgi:hypothetical protein
MQKARVKGDGESAPRKRLSYANVVATLALVLALGGGTAWATNYIIVSTHQIRPSVLKSLRGNRGPRGYAGTDGTNGTNGTNGPTGPAGAPGSNLTAETVLPSGQSESGTYGGSGGTGVDFGITVQYTEPLASPIARSNIVETYSTTSNCPGQGQAARGYLCLYDLQNYGSTFEGPIDNYDELPSPDPGALLYYASDEASGYAWGTWTVTAP